MSDEKKRKTETSLKSSPLRKPRRATHGIFDKELTKQELQSQVASLVAEVSELRRLVDRRTFQLRDYSTTDNPVEIPIALELTNRRVARESVALLAGLNEVRTHVGLPEISLPKEEPKEE